MSEAFEMARAVTPEHLAGLFVRQPQQLGVGHVVLYASRAVGDDAFAVLLSNDPMFQEAGGPMGNLIAACASSGKSTISLAETPLSEVGKCGVAAPSRELSETMLEVATLQEIPSSEAAPSLLAGLGCYPCSPETLDIIEHTERGAGGEIQFADAINQPARRSSFVTQQFEGRRYDGCDKLGYAEAVVDAAIQNAHIAREIEKLWRSMDFESVASRLNRRPRLAPSPLARPPHGRALQRGGAGRKSASTVRTALEGPVVLDRVKRALPGARGWIRGNGPLTGSGCCNVRARGDSRVRDAARIGNLAQCRAV